MTLDRVFHMLDALLALAQRSSQCRSIGPPVQVGIT
jgi:hypothetical protein